MNLEKTLVKRPATVRNRRYLAILLLVPASLIPGCSEGGGTTAGSTSTTSSSSLGISSVSPTSGSTGGDTDITIEGSGFQDGATVKFGTESAKSVSVGSSNQISALTPSHPAGTVDVTVTNPDGASATESNAFTFEEGTTPAPTISSVSPTSGPTSGGTNVTIQGADFIDGATVEFGGLNATSVTFTSATQLEVVTPAHLSGTFEVKVTNPDLQSGTLPDAFTFTGADPAPTVDSVSPNSGTSAGGTLVTIEGANFNSNVTVEFGNTGATGVMQVSISEIRATTPPHTAGTVDVTVTNADGQSGTLVDGFTFTQEAAPIVQNTSPDFGPRTGGTNVTITGSNFQGGASVFLGGTDVTVLSVPSSSKINIETPAHAAGKVDVTVTNPDGGSGTLADGFTFVPLVQLTWVASSSTVDGFNIYRSTQSGGPYSRLNSALISTTSFTDKTVEPAMTYFYVATAVDGGQESDLSNEASAVIPSF